MSKAMATISLCSPVLSPQPSSDKSRYRKTVIQQRRKRSSAKVFAAKRDGNSDGRLVDENMVVLRKRIHEMKKMVQGNGEPPAEWTEWEKRYYAEYDSDVCEAVGFLQVQLMNTRPGLTLGMAAFVTLSIPASTVIMAFHLMEILSGILSGIHPN